MVKKTLEEQKARLAIANAQEVYRLRELEVEKKVGIANENTQFDISLELKKREIALQAEEKKRMEIEAEAQKTAKILKAQGEAESERLRKLADLETEAEGIRQKMNAQAEGFKKQVEAMSSGDQRFLAVKLVESLPEIFKHISPEKMVVVGDGKNAFGSIANSLIPFVELIPMFSEQLQEVYSKVKTQEPATGKGSK